MPRTPEQKARNAEVNRAWRQDNRAKVAAATRRWVQKNPERAKQIRAETEKRCGSTKKWREAHPERVKELKRLSYARHKEAIQARRREQRAAASDEEIQRLREAVQARYNKNRDKIRAVENAKRAENREFFRAKGREWAQKNRAAYLLNSVRSRSRKIGVECTLTLDWMKSRFEAGVCEMTGLAFDMNGRRSRLSPSIDRKDPKGPYTVENCRLIIWAMNRALCDDGEAFMFDIFARAMARAA